MIRAHSLISLRRDPPLPLPNLLPRIVEAPADDLALGHRAELPRFAFEVVVEQLQTGSLLNRLDYRDQRLNHSTAAIVGRTRSDERPQIRGIRNLLVRKNERAHR
jgi:hypothetical protein